MDVKVLKTYEFHLKDNRIVLIKKGSVSKAIRSLKNDYNLDLHLIKSCFSNNKKVPSIYLYKIIKKNGKEKE